MAEIWAATSAEPRDSERSIGLQRTPRRMLLTPSREHQSVGIIP
jgi:hypothetical protein